MDADAVAGSSLEAPLTELPPITHRYVQASQWAEWLPTLFQPKQFLTMTSRDEVHEDTLLRRHGYLLRKMNKAIFGNNWTRRGEGISYMLGLERQKRGVLHLHAVWDAPFVPYDQFHSICNRISGFALIEPVDAATGVAYYVAKYSAKGGRIEVYLTRQMQALLGTGGP